jgi:hypothetical protein
MKSPGVIYRKYRQLRKKLLYQKMVEAKKKIHNNCHYASVLSYTDADGYEKKVKLCTYDFKKNKNLDVCTCPRDCSAFISIWTKDKVVEEFEKILKNNRLKHKLFPELVAYEWVLDKTLTEAKENNKGVGRLVVWTIDLLEKILKFLSGTEKNLMEDKKE